MRAVDASADGRTVVGTGSPPTPIGIAPAYYWSETRGLSQLTASGAGNTVNSAGVGGISADGLVVFGWLYFAPTNSMYFPVAWTPTTSDGILTFLTPVNATGRGRGGDISADGTRLAALYDISTPLTTTAFIRDSAGGPWTALDTPSSQRRFSSVLLSRSAQHACGGFTTDSIQNIRGYAWSASGGFTEIGVPVGFLAFNPLAISDDGRVIGGTARVNSPPSNILFAPFLWTQASGYRALPLPPSAVTGGVNGITGDGIIAIGQVGNSSGFSNARGVAWTPQGVMSVAELAIDAGISVSNIEFLSADVIAADGSFIIGSGSRRVGTNVVLDTYILRNIFIPRCDTIDFNRNGVFPEDQDVIDFFSVFSGGACSTGATCGDIDFNNNAMFPEDQDVVDFFDALAGGAC